MYTTKKSRTIRIFVALVCLLTISLCLYLVITFELDDAKDTDIEKPHIITIIADDMGWNDVSYHGSNEIPTPNIDALAYNGVILRNHYVLPICTPSRTSFFTGRYAIRAGMQGFPLRAGEPRGIPLGTKLLPEYLKNLGYSTRLVGKWHLGYQSDDFTPARRGFDTFFGYYAGYITYYNHTITQSGQTGHDFHRDDSMGLKADWSRQNEYATDVFADEAVRIIEEHDGRRPLYLQLSHLAPHASDGDETLETRNFTAVNETFHYIRDIKRRKYAGMVTALDDSVGRVMRALSNNNLLKNSIVMLFADNGAPTLGIHENRGSNYPFRGQKQSFYEGGVHGVACVYSPLIKNPGRIVNDLVHVTDWLPTLYNAAGGDVNDLGVIDGINQWPTIKLGQFGNRQSLLVNIDETIDREAAIIGDFKLLKKGAMIPIYDSHLGSHIDDGDPSVPPYNITAIMSSPASLAIFRTMGNYARPKKILHLRQESKITCAPFTEIANCSEICLFNLNTDPCETRDISSDHPEMVELLEEFIGKYREHLMNQTNAPVDPRSYPIYHNGSWMPWMTKNQDMRFTTSARMLPDFGEFFDL
ncbi:arylsulfatase B-like [Fopius arisanus]|uniref:Arylsulfatase B-like n=1 Tax=Fopius arisanus TaxID=64838 RepID=A0A9R1T862_9HYME|nr:PREDICTED: arylsulfatase B-like [Fopius arisanus]